MGVNSKNENILRWSSCRLFLKVFRQAFGASTSNVCLVRLLNEERTRLKIVRLPPMIGKHDLTRYSITDLGNLGGADSAAFGLNNRGQVVGHADTPDEDEWGRAIKHAFLWEHGHIIELGTFADVSARRYRYQNSVAHDINDAGLIVGQANDDLDQRWPCCWQEGQAARLGTLGGRNGTANAISESGLIVGESGTVLEGGWSHAFLYRSGKMLDLGTVGGTFSHAYGVNDAEEIAGLSATTGNGGCQGFLWERGRMRGLGTNPDFMPTMAKAVNTCGQVIGVAQPQERTGLPSVSRTGTAHAFLWSTDSGMTDLGTLPGGGTSRADGINESGQIVGASDTVAPRPWHAFLWEGGQMTDLNDLIPPDAGWELISAHTINESGQIVGYGYCPPTDPVGAPRLYTHAFLLTPF